MCVPGVARSVTDDGSLTQFAGCLRPHSLLRKEKNMFAKLNFYSLNISENMLLFAREIYLLDLVLNEHIYERSFEKKVLYRKMLQGYISRNLARKYLIKYFV